MCSTARPSPIMVKVEDSRKEDAISVLGFQRLFEALTYPLPLHNDCRTLFSSATNDGQAFAASSAVIACGATCDRRAKKGASNHGIQPRKHERNEDAGKSLPCIDDRHVEMVEKEELCTENLIWVKQ